MDLKPCLFALAVAMGAGGAALAHPHAFVDVAAGFRFDSAGRIEALRISWTYDAFTSLTLFDILDLDRDGDGNLDDADRAAIVAGETDWPEGYEGDTYLEMDGAGVPLTRPVGGTASIADDRITVAFDLPLETPLVIEGDVILKLYDPTYYYAYTAVGIEGSVPEGCVVEIIPFVPNAATEVLQVKLAALSREETPEQENVGRLFAEEVWLLCD